MRFHFALIDPRSRLPLAAAVFALLITAAFAVPSLAGSATTGRAVSWRPRAWHPPERATAPTALRSDPDDGAPATDLSGLSTEIRAQRRALADVPVQTRADGSRFARVGGHARQYTVARIAADGSLQQVCVHSEAEAKRLVAAPAPAPAKGR